MHEFEGLIDEKLLRELETPSERAAYVLSVQRGLLQMSASSAVICALARNLGDVFEKTKFQVKRLAGRFREAAIIILENDSTDETAKRLRDWSKEDARLQALTLTLGRKYWGTVGDLGRTVDMADYRNRCLDIVAADHRFREYTIWVDSDLPDGWDLAGLPIHWDKTTGTSLDR